MQDCTKPMSSPTNQFLDKLFANYEKAIVKNVLLTQENEKLLTANKKQQKKRKSQYIPEGGAAKHIQRDETEVNDSVQQGDSGSV